MAEPISQNAPGGNQDRIAADEAITQIRDSLRGLRFGSVNVIVQDGVIIQIDRTEKRRMRVGRGSASK